MRRQRTANLLELMRRYANEKHQVSREGIYAIILLSFACRAPTHGRSYTGASRDRFVNSLAWSKFIF
jgi:hypothetical protein